MRAIANNVTNQNKNNKTPALEEDSVINFDLNPLNMSGRPFLHIIGWESKPS